MRKTITVRAVGRQCEEENRCQANIEKEAEWQAARRHVQLRQTFYGQVPAALLQSRNIRPGAKTLFALLHKYCPQKNLQKNPEATVAKETLAKDLGVSHDRIHVWINELKREGWISVHRRGRMQSNKYILYPVSKRIWGATVAIKRVHLKVGSDRALGRRLSASLYPNGRPVIFSSIDRDCSPVYGWEDVPPKHKLHNGPIPQSWAEMIAALRLPFPPLR